MYVPSRILIVDPDELPKMELAIQLQEMGFKVEVAENGGEALEIVAESHPDLVITELLLGQLSGFEVSSCIAADPNFSCPVLFYTGFYRSETARLEIIKKYSAAGYFIKPFQLPQLRKAVAGIMRPKGDDHIGVANEERAEGRGGPALPIAQTPADAVEGTSAQAIIPNLFAPMPEAEEGNKDATQEGMQASDSMKEGLIIAGQVLVPSIEPTTRLVGTEAILRELASEAELGRDYEVPGQSGAQMPSPVRSPQPSSRGLVDEPLSSFLSSARPARRSKSIPIFVALVFVLIGLSLAYFSYHRRFFPSHPLKTVQSSAQQPPSSMDLKSTGGNTQPDNQLVREDKLEKPADPIQPSAGAQPAVRSILPQEAGPLSPGSQTPPVETRDPDRLQHGLPSALAVKVSEVSGKIGPPHLLRSPRMEISTTAAKTVAKPLVVRFEVGPLGRVVALQIINQSQENTALVPIVQATLSEWEFTSTEVATGKTLVKYFSFKVVPAVDATAPSR
jgi:CheY-like chemotaxis protein